MYFLTLVRVESTHNNLRTPTVTGWSYNLPEVGASFQIFNDQPLEAPEVNKSREVTTSVVREVQTLDTGDVLFKTMNSTYILENIRKLTEDDGC